MVNGDEECQDTDDSPLYSLVSRLPMSRVLRRRRYMPLCGYVSFYASNLSKNYHSVYGSEE